MPEHGTPPSALTHYDPAELLDALATGIVILDAQLCATYANVAAQDLLAFGLQSARGRPFPQLLFDAGGFTTLLQRALSSGEGLADSELTLRPAAAPREARTLQVTITPVDGVTGRQLLLEFADATQRRRIERESDLRARIDGSRIMLRQLAHEVKNPLGGLRGAAQLLERELPSAALREYTQVIIGEADRLAALMDRMAAPHRSPERQRLNIHEVCERVYQLLCAEAAAAVRIERDYDPSLPELRCDRDELLQALLNVARNAMQAVGSAGQVRLRTRAMPARPAMTRCRLAAGIQVEDDGPGVPESLRGSIFMPLVTGREGGSGLGLAIAQELVSRNGGLIEFESEPGRTVFTLLLPIEDTLGGAST